jgi:hypothetical protein
MHWRKLGLIFAPPQDLPWMRTHAMLPNADHLGGDRYRIYFSGRDDRGRAQIGWFELDITAPDRVAAVSEQPAVTIGPLGAFDDNGATNACVVHHGGRIYQYYTGWTLGVTVPFFFYVGLAISDDGGASFRKVSPAPILGRSTADPFLTAAPCVLVEEGRWRMWYVSCSRWELREGKPVHYYNIRYAESDDGVSWRRDGTVCIDYQSPDEYAIARPWVVKVPGGYEMWYSHRGDSYRIGYAVSKDGIIWERRDSQAGIAPSETGWDAEMVAYAHVLDHGGRRYMLYNGNGYGKSGIGLAVLEQ